MECSIYVADLSVAGVEGLIKDNYRRSRSATSKRTASKTTTPAMIPRSKGVSGRPRRDATLTHLHTTPMPIAVCAATFAASSLPCDNLTRRLFRHVNIIDLLVIGINECQRGGS